MIQEPVQMMCPKCQIPKVVYFVGLDHEDLKRLRAGDELTLGHDCDSEECELRKWTIAIRWTRKSKVPDAVVDEHIVEAVLNEQIVGQLHNVFMQTRVEEHLDVCIFCDKNVEALRSRISHMTREQGLHPYHSSPSEN